MTINSKRINLEWQILRAVELGDKTSKQIAERIGCSEAEVDYVAKCILADMLAEMIMKILKN